MKKLLLLTFLVLIQPCLSFSKDYEFYEADIGRCMVLKFNDNTGVVSLQQYKYDTCSSRQTYLIPMVRTAARYEVLIKETDGDFIDYVFLSEAVLINSNADGAIVEHRLKDHEIQKLSRAIEAGESFNIAYFNGDYWTGPRFDLPNRIEPILAIECSTDPKECTPKKLCEFATDQDGSNTVWSGASNKLKHVRFAQSLGMTCGVITVLDPCDLDPNECKISQLCEKATTDNGGQTFWNRAAQDYVDVAKEYGMSCGVKATSLDCSKTSADDEIAICDAPENSKPFLINSYDLIRHNLSEITGLSPQCISYEFENASADKADWTLREIHNAQCVGDPETSPTIVFLKTAIDQPNDEISLSIYDMPCGCWMLLNY